MAAGVSHFTVIFSGEMGRICVWPVEAESVREAMVEAIHKMMRLWETHYSWSTAMDYVKQVDIYDVLPGIRDLATVFPIKMGPMARAWDLVKDNLPQPKGVKEWRPA